MSWIRGFQKDYFGRRQKLFFWLLIQTKMVTGYVLCFKEILLASERSLSIFFFVRKIISLIIIYTPSDAKRRLNDYFYIGGH